MALEVAIIIVILILLIYNPLIIEGHLYESCSIALWMFGPPDVDDDNPVFKMWDRDTVKLIIEGGNSMPIRLYIQIDPITSDDVEITRSVVRKRLASMSSDNIVYNFANFQFAIKDKDLESAFIQALNLKKIASGAPPLRKDELRLIEVILKFKSTFF